MFFIFGWGHKTDKNHGPVKIYHCEHCNNDKYWMLHTRKTWFTLFFIPIIPYSIEHLIFCPVCLRGIKLDTARFNGLRAIAQCNSDLISRKITEEQHARILRGLVKGANEDYADSNSAIPKTQTQLNYIKQMNEFRQQENSK